MSNPDLSCAGSLMRGFFFYPHLGTFFPLIFSERAREREKRGRRREASICYLPYTPRLGPSLQPFGYMATLQPTEPRRPGRRFFSVNTQPALRIPGFCTCGSNQPQKESSISGPGLGIHDAEGQLRALLSTLLYEGLEHPWVVTSGTSATQTLRGCS